MSDVMAIFPKSDGRCSIYIFLVFVQGEMKKRLVLESLEKIFKKL
jgi:hypothetical protein